MPLPVRPLPIRAVYSRTTTTTTDYEPDQSQVTTRPHEVNRSKGPPLGGTLICLHPQRSVPLPATVELPPQSETSNDRDFGVIYTAYASCSHILRYCSCAAGAPVRNAKCISLSTVSSFLCLYSISITWIDDCIGQSTQVALNAVKSTRGPDGHAASACVFEAQCGRGGFAFLLLGANCKMLAESRAVVLGWCSELIPVCVKREAHAQHPKERAGCRRVCIRQDCPCDYVSKTCLNHGASSAHDIRAWCGWRRGYRCGSFLPSRHSWSARTPGPIQSAWLRERRESGRQRMGH